MTKLKVLTKQDKSILKLHKVHHTKKHMDMMTKLMKSGKTFNQAHIKTKKMVGK